MCRSTAETCSGKADEVSLLDHGTTSPAVRLRSPHWSIKLLLCPTHECSDFGGVVTVGSSQVDHAIGIISVGAFPAAPSSLCAITQPVSITTILYICAKDSPHIAATKAS